jgi:hypothetical protein
VPVNREPLYIATTVLSAAQRMDVAAEALSAPEWLAITESYTGIDN